MQKLSVIHFSFKCPTEVNSYLLLIFSFYSAIAILVLFFPITDIDECSTGNGRCHDKSTCTNTIGSRTCLCKAGFSGNGTLCVGM